MASFFEYIKAKIQRTSGAPIAVDHYDSKVNHLKRQKELLVLKKELTTMDLNIYNDIIATIDKILEEANEKIELEVDRNISYTWKDVAGNVLNETKSYFSVLSKRQVAIRTGNSEEIQNSKIEYIIAHEQAVLDYINDVINNIIINVEMKSYIMHLNQIITSHKNLTGINTIDSLSDATVINHYKEVIQLTKDAYETGNYTKTVELHQLEAKIIEITASKEYNDAMEIKERVDRNK